MPTASRASVTFGQLPDLPCQSLSRPNLPGDTAATGDDATVALDARYNVIANVLAHNTHENGMDDRLNDVALREECLNW